MACEKIKTEQVVCDEIFYLDEVSQTVEIGLEVPEESTLTGTVQVTLQSCAVTVDEDNDEIDVDFVFMIQKELTMTTPENVEFPLEFAERLFSSATFAKCTPSVLETLGISLDDLKCQVVFVNGEDFITLDTDNNQFTEILNPVVKLKLVREVQEIVQLCPDNQQANIIPEQL